MKRAFALALLAAGVAVLLLSPLGQVLRTQQPFSCFGLTFDENFYLHSIHHHAATGELRADWMSKSFEPILTIGPPIAWGAELVHATIGRALRLDWPQSARLFTQITFLLLLIVLSRRVALRSRRGIGVLLFLWIAVTWLRENPLGGYLVYGVLGEMPATLLTWLGFLSLRRKRNALFSGPLLVLAVLAKPSFLPALPAGVLAALSQGFEKGKRAMISILVSSSLAIAWVLRSRGEQFSEYWKVFSGQASSVSPVGGAAETFHYFSGYSWLILSYLIFVLVVGLQAVIVRRRRRALDATDRAALFLFAIGVLYYFVFFRLPQPKHVFVLFQTGALWGAMEFSIFLARKFGPKLDRLLPEQPLRAAFAAVVLVWVLHIPSMNLRIFREAQVEVCPVKQQRELDRRFTALYRSGTSKSEFAELTSPSSSHFLYELGFSPQSARAWSELPRPLPRYIAGDLAAMEPLPRGCRYEWKASEMALAECRR